MKQFFKYVLATIVGIIVINIIGFFFFAMVIGIIVSSTEKQMTVQDKSLLVIDLSHKVVDRATNYPFDNLEVPGISMEKTIGLNNISKALKNATTDNRIKGVYLKLSVFNGGTASAEEIRNMLIQFKDSCDKPVYANSEMMMDQKSYYLASVADKIVIHPMGTIDFRGLGGELMFFKDLLKKIGIEPQVIRHGKFKAAVEPFVRNDMSKANREQTMIYLNSLWNTMLDGISERRNISVDSLNALADEVQSFKKGEELVAVGLADAALFKDEVLDDLREITGVKEKKPIPVIGVTDYAKAPVKVKIPKYSRNKIAVIYASGEIGAAMSSVNDKGIVGAELGREIRKVRQDSTYKAIVFRVNSPGGSVFDSEVIWREVKLAAETKPLVVSFGDVAASGGYYISCPADLIVAEPTTITGSIGIFGIIPNMEVLLNDKLGITTDVVKTNKNANLLSVSRPMTGYESAMMQKNIEEGYDTFIGHVAEGRKMDIAAVDSIGQGRVWSGKNAKEIGLVDEFGGLETAITRAAEIAGLEDYRTVALPALPDPFQSIFKNSTDNLRTRFLKKELGDSYRYFNFAKKSMSMKGVYARMPYDIYVN